MYKIGSEIKIEEKEDLQDQTERMIGETEVKIEFDPLLYPPVVWQPLRRIATPVNAMVRQQAKDPSRGNQLKYIRKAYVQALQSCISQQEFADFIDKFRRYRRSTAIIFCVLMHLLIQSPHAIQSFVQKLREKIEAFAQESLLDEPETHCLYKFLNEFLFGVSSIALSIFFQMFQTTSYNSSKAARLIKVLQRTSLQDLESLDIELQSSASFSEESVSKVRQVQARKSESESNVEVEMEESRNKIKIIGNDPFNIYKRDDPSQNRLYPTDTQFAINNWMDELIPKE